ncbi:MAG: ATP-binding protein [Clostridia bacterium]|nr:ATP-binding protein [Clostridia bacterium]MBQ9993915.1 ATP-binding protein [Clostridia bacterium]
MGFSTEIYSIASERLRQRRAAAIGEAKILKDAFLLAHPRYAELERELSQTGALLARTIFCDGSGSADVTSIRERNLKLQQDMADILREAGLAADALEPHFECSMCDDSGIVDGRLCECIQRIMRQIAYDRLNATTPLALSTFDSFSLEHYSDSVDCGRGLTQRRVMELIFGKCKKYAESFSLSSPSMLFQGGVGLGKTHLSLAIAGAVIEKGYDVVYGSSNTFFGKIERERFGKTNSGEDTLSLLNSCDLLIIDDLGAEFVTQFTVSVLYDIVNTRLLSGRPTIISTNLSFEGLEQKYSERLVSRIHGNYSCYQFAGKDMRITLRKARRSE